MRKNQKYVVVTEFIASFEITREMATFKRGRELIYRGFDNPIYDAHFLHYYGEKISLTASEIAKWLQPIVPSYNAIWNDLNG